MTTDKVKIKRYLEAVVKSVVVYFSKFSSLIFDSSGYNCISLYEIFYYFLELKQYIYSRPEVFQSNESSNKKIFFRNKFKGHYDLVELINPDKINHDQNKKREKKNGFDKRYLKKEKKNKINLFM